MPFEPLRTDEKTDGTTEKPRDMDAQMLHGCTSFVVVSAFAYVLAVWPFFAFGETHTYLGLATSCAFGMIPASVFGALATRRAGLAAACGALGAAMATAVFLFLRLEQMMLGNTVQQLPAPEYPSSWVWMVPLAYVLATFGLAAVFMPKGQFTDEGGEPGTR